jgi:hypothetical protein
VGSDRAGADGGGGVRRLSPRGRLGGNGWDALPLSEDQASVILTRADTSAGRPEQAPATGERDACFRPGAEVCRESRWTAGAHRSRCLPRAIRTLASGKNRSACFVDSVVVGLAQRADSHLHDWRIERTARA